MTRSDASRWRSVQGVADAALDLPAEARAAYIEEACGDAPDLRDDVIRFLNACAHAERVEGVLDSPALVFAAPLFTDALSIALSGRYTIERELGRGGMPRVYLARDVRHDRQVAIKVFESGIAHAGAERFLLEIRTAARLTHPHVLGVHDSGEADGLLYYVMPYVEGETLRARLTREGALPLPDVARLVRELADALAYAHGQGVMHRDLKPENVLISGGHAVVADFGIAKAIAAAASDGTAPDRGLTSAGVALGTPAYMAPEQAVADVAIDHRADLYALGVIAYEAARGNPSVRCSVGPSVRGGASYGGAATARRPQDRGATELDRADHAAHRQGSRRTPAERRGGTPRARCLAARTRRAHDNIVADIAPAFRRHGVIARSERWRIRCVARDARARTTWLRAERQRDSHPGRTAIREHRRRYDGRLLQRWHDR